MEMNTPSKVASAAVSAYLASKRSLQLRQWDTRDATLMELIAQSEDRPMQLRVWNVKSQTTRELQLTPSHKWPVKGLLGVTIRFDSYEGAEDN
ncbi:hypothetical protein PsorP6_005170 [Peronosclerospora sorghi]|uniref:Uncharacterized protein n=1 Tax=Peronosclerospora sorghi TaxID=230839 RepID=A0ACC0W5R4_9STRA|nr:hypothetical protein PsorP6_005170 [Peronosclerospora sorghi]